MGRQEYLIEQLGADGHWWIVGSDPTSGWAQHYMREYRKAAPKAALRVVEHPSRRLITLAGGEGT